MTRGAEEIAGAREWARLHCAASRAVSARLVATFTALRAPLAGPAAALSRRPGAGRWSALEVAEHVALASGFLLLLARKIEDRAQRRIARGASWPTAAPDLAGLAAVATDRGRWEHPAHMSPTGALSPAEVGARLVAAGADALALLGDMPAGQGTLHGIRLSVLPSAPRLDLIGFLEFVARHAERHVRQMHEALGGAQSL